MGSFFVVFANKPENKMRISSLTDRLDCVIVKNDDITGCKRNEWLPVHRPHLLL